MEVGVGMIIFKFVKILLKLYYRKHPDFLVYSFSINEMTEMSIICETWKNGIHSFGTREEKYE